MRCLYGSGDLWRSDCPYFAGLQSQRCAAYREPFRVCNVVLFGQGVEIFEEGEDAANQIHFFFEQ